MKQILFVCIHNSGRSQMAEAFANRLGAGRVVAESAGTAPGGSLNPQAVAVMEEIGYDLSDHHPKIMTPAMVAAADRVITMGCGVNLEDLEAGGPACPAVLVPSQDWGLDDPQGQPIEKVRTIRDQIQRRVEQLITQLIEAED